MRNATIMVVNLKGVATETIKNIVLAGIGKLIIVDDQVVSEEDLGAGFFFRDEEVGQKVATLFLQHMRKAGAKLREILAVFCRCNAVHRPSRISASRLSILFDPSEIYAILTTFLCGP